MARAVEAKVADFLDKQADLKSTDRHQPLVRRGHLPERAVTTGIGPIAVRNPGRIRIFLSILPQGRDQPGDVFQVGEEV